MTLKYRTSYSNGGIAFSKDLNFFLRHHTTSVNYFYIYRWEGIGNTIASQTTIYTSKPTSTTYFIRNSEHFISDDGRVAMVLRGSSVTSAQYLSIYTINGSSYDDNKFHKTIPSNESSYQIRSSALISTDTIIVGSTVSLTSSLCQFRIESINFETGQN